MAENFERVTFLWQPNFNATDKMLNHLDAKHVLAEKPDFVIEDVVERYMAYDPPGVEVEQNPADDIDDIDDIDGIYASKE
jgi:hypothetical protein